MNREYVAEGESLLGSQYYTDVNGDDRTSALDALQVINFLKRQANSQLQDGEQIAQPITSNAADLSSSADAVFAGLDQDDEDKIAATDLSAPAASIGSISVSTTNNDADDDDDDVLSLLADDVSNLWG
jgi:hypothetical protein